jgi:hypothetical protein
MSRETAPSSSEEGAEVVEHGTPRRDEAQRQGLQVIRPPVIGSVGAPPEQHADRVVAEMLRFLVRGRLARDAHIKAALNLPDGNPLAQQKLARRLDEQGWPFVFNVELAESGKRGRYTLHFFGLDGFSPVTRQIIEAERDLPNKPWLALSSFLIVSKGRHTYDEKSGIVMLITHHALSRLAQRTSVRTVTDVYCALIGLWSAHFDHVVEHGPYFRDGQRLEFQLGPDGGSAVAVLTHHRDKKKIVVVSTILEKA